MDSFVTFFLPVRKGSQRVKNKNVRKFGPFEGGLLELKLEQLINSQTIGQIILSTNCEESIEIAKKFVEQDERLVIDRRPEELCLDSTPLSKLIEYVGQIVKGGHVCWGHVTTPLVSADIYDKAITKYLSLINEGSCDSLVSVLEIKNFFLDKNAKLINGRVGEKWPRTQDLESIYEINHAMFISPILNYVKLEDRIGVKPMMYPMGKVESFDVDWLEDFVIAEQLYTHMYGESK